MTDKIEALREKATGLVKPLEWTNVAVDGGFPRLQAETPFGQTMEIFVAWWGNAGKYGYVYTGSDDGPFFHTADDAKTAAQADYERRTLSALDLSELDRLRSSNEAMRKALEEAREVLSARASTSYCRSLDKFSETLCLGWEAKVKSGSYSLCEHEAHAEANRLMGRHIAFAEAAKLIADALSLQEEEAR